jgi:hypothetical protein
MKYNDIQKSAVSNGFTNFIINGIINWFMLDKSQTTIYLTQDQISSNTPTVFASAVPLAVSLAFILTSVVYTQIKNVNKPKYFPTYFIKAVKHSIYAFGLVVIFALLLQRYAGNISVSLPIAAVIAGIIAGVVSAIVDYETKKSLIQ